MLFYNKFPNKNIPIPTYGNRENIAPDLTKKIVICLGCSHTFGGWEEGVMPDNETWPAQLQTLLGDEYQVLNMGRCAYGLGLNIAWYFHFVKYKPYLCIMQLPQFFRQPYPDLQADITSNYTLFTGAFSLFQKMGQAKWLFSADKMIIAEINRLNLFLDELNQNETKSLVFMYDSFRDLRDINNLYYSKVKSLCKSKNIACLADDSLSVSAFENKNWLMDKSHPNIFGNKYIADKLHESMLANSFC